MGSGFSAKFLIPGVARRSRIAVGHAVTTRDSIDVNHLRDGHCNYSLLEQVKTMRLERGTKILVVKSQ